MLLRKSEKTTPSESHEFHGIRGWKSSQLAWNLETSTKCAASSIGDFEIINHKKSCKKGGHYLGEVNNQHGFYPCSCSRDSKHLIDSKHKIVWMMPVTTTTPTTTMMIIMTMMIRDLFPIRNLFWGLIFHVAGQNVCHLNMWAQNRVTPFTPQITGLGLRSLKFGLHNVFAIFCYSRWVSGYNKPIWELCHVLWRCTFLSNNNIATNSPNLHRHFFNTPRNANGQESHTGRKDLWVHEFPNDLGDVLGDFSTLGVIVNQNGRQLQSLGVELKVVNFLTKLGFRCRSRHLPPEHPSRWSEIFDDTR